LFNKRLKSKRRIEAMKTTVKLTFLIAALLLLPGVAFAADCYCYEITFTFLDDPLPSSPGPVKICFNGDNVGDIYGLTYNLCAPPDPLFMFFDSMNEQALASHPSPPNTAYLKFHGDNQYCVTGIVIGDGRYSFRGYKTDMSYCDEVCF
jgi:hypothetical protein